MNTSGLTPHVEGFGAVRQLGYVVENLEAAIEEHSATGLGPWTIMRNVRLNSIFFGQPSEPLISIALAYRDDLQIELIEQLNDAPSPYQAMVQSKNYGLHHQAFLCDHINGDIERAQSLGLSLACDIHAIDGARYAYFSPLDLHDEQPLYIEFLQSTRLMRAMFRYGAKAAVKAPKAGPVEMDLNNPLTIATSLTKAIPAMVRQYRS